MAVKITHLEKTVKDLGGKLQAAENSAKANDTSSQRITRPKPALIPTELTDQINDLSEKTTMLQDRLQEVEDIVE
jgi:predicted Zn-dependent protease